MSASKQKFVWVVWQNTDLCEGRGGLVPLAVCETPETALRIGKGKDVQGCDCNFTKEKAYLHKLEDTGGSLRSYWYAPCRILSENDQDKQARKIREEKEKRMEKFNESVEKAKRAGLSDEDIKNLIAGTK
jgi:hypothetical protein